LGARAPTFELEGHESADLDGMMEMTELLRSRYCKRHARVYHVCVCVCACLITSSVTTISSNIETQPMPPPSSRAEVSVACTMSADRSTCSMAKGQPVSSSSNAGRRERSKQSNHCAYSSGIDERVVASMERSACGSAACGLAACGLAACGLARAYLA
jgi:hypothetical protein